LFHLVLESHDGRAPGADSEEKHEPVSDIDTVVVDSLKALDPEWPIREADISEQCRHVRLVPILVSCGAANEHLPDQRGACMVFLIDYLCHAGQKQLVDVDIAWEIAKPLQDTGDSTYFRLRNASGRFEEFAFTKKVVTLCNLVWL